MTRRDFTLLGLSAGGAAAFGGLAAAQDRPGAKGAVGHKAGDPTLLTCAKACSDCQRECDGCATHCAELLQKGERDHFTTLQTCLDCADVCAAAPTSWPAAGHSRTSSARRASTRARSAARSVRSSPPASE